MTDETNQGPTEALRPLMEECIKPNAERLAKIMMAGEIAFAVYKPDAAWCKALGIPSGTHTAVAKMPGPVRKNLIEKGDSVTSRWARGGRTGRVFAIVNSGSVLLNFAEGANGGWSIEPGSTDGEAS